LEVIDIQSGRGSQRHRASPWCVAPFEGDEVLSGPVDGACPVAGIEKCDLVYAVAWTLILVGAAILVYVLEATGGYGPLDAGGNG
jgi:hypothetical protein